MSPPGRAWNEASVSEHPAIWQLVAFGYSFIAAETLEAERESLKEVVLTQRLAKGLKKLNPWLSDDNVHKAVRAVTGVQATSLIEASQEVYTTLTLGKSFEQDRGEGKKSYDVRYIDFERPREQRADRHAPVQGQGRQEAHHSRRCAFRERHPNRHRRVQEPDPGRRMEGRGSRPVLSVPGARGSLPRAGRPEALRDDAGARRDLRQAAVYATVTTPHRFYAEWKQPYPRTLDQLERELGRAPLAQDVLCEGMLRPEALLDLVRNFVVFERDADTGKTVRKLCRYQQFAAVNKAVSRARTAKRPTDRGGVVWHTQGSGKSLTMLWLALKLRRDSYHDNPTIVIVTDRVDLDQQITKTFLACGVPNPERAESVREMRELLSGSTGKTVMTTVQKFQELAGSGDPKKRSTRDEHPVLSTADNIFVLVDEAHRSQYGGLAANLRQALPNACLFGFTGTPIDKKDRSTLETFGPYIDTYTIEQAVADGATVPIFYEGRLTELRIIGNTLDAVFDRVFADRSDEEREAIKKKYATEASIAGAPKRVEAICLDLIDHFTRYIRPNQFKAQIVTCSREVAALYKETLDCLNAPQSAIMISGSNKDDERLVRHHTSEEQRRQLINDHFLKKGDSPNWFAVAVTTDAPNTTARGPERGERWRRVRGCDVRDDRPGTVVAIARWRERARDGR